MLKLKSVNQSFSFLNLTVSELYFKKKTARGGGGGEGKIGLRILNIGYWAYILDRN